MKPLKRQDKTGTRTSEELRRRYKLNEIELSKDEIEYLKQFIETDSTLSVSSIRPVQNKVITQALNNKVNKEVGKELSSNDFTQEYVEQIEANTSDRHKHDNQEILDKITEENLTPNTSITTEDYAGEIKIGSICMEYGNIEITPTANTPTSQIITFKNTYKNIPIVIVTADTEQIGVEVLGVSVNGISKTYATAILTRTNDITTNIHYVVIGEIESKEEV